MKKWIKTLFLILAVSSMHAQIESNLFHSISGFSYDEYDLDSIANHSILKLDIPEWYHLLDHHPAHISLEIPYKDYDLKAVLRVSNVYGNDFKVKTASGESINLNAVSKSVYYQGYFEGFTNSHFAFSVLNNEIIGVGSIPGIGDVNLGKLEGLNYIFYSEKDLNGHNQFLCETRGDPGTQQGYREIESDERELVDDCSGIYVEADYDLFLNKGGVLETVDYITALFNEIQLLYEIDEMTIFMSELMVWDVESPYFGITDTGILLDLFGTTTVDWEGDLGHLVTLAASGGLAWVDVFCSPDQAIRKAVSGISPTFAEIPIYSWSVEVIAHEMGHNMGSPHTHACFWNGDDTAIDGCGPEAGFDEGCDEDLPAEGGTVMSYCHLTDVGIDLGLGFGEQPGDHMRARILASDCLESCDLTVMDMTITGGLISTTCDNAPIYRQLSVENNSNDDFTSAQINVYIEGELVESHSWSGFIPEDGVGTINIPATSLPVGSYIMQVVLDFPSGYEDDNPIDNSFTFNFDVHPYPTAGFYPDPVQMVSYDATSTMTNTSEGATTFTWNMGDESPLIYGTNPTHTFPFERGDTYNITLVATSEFGCNDTATSSVIVEGVNIFFIENSFTPSGDLFNEEFTPVFAAGLDIYDYHFVVYNRWGEVMFETFNVAYGWNGKYGDKLAPAGSYVWVLEFGDLSSDEKHAHQGHVTLLR